ncbi:MAG: bifunctional 5,10-methylenetetrahydrofolate dehydrogenase/5,10-methenyltetrahydrofolate cyclohydrolase [Candidatus Omnitrophica bacterium]|nr:bifunctional 5,10-methylenetetrahydrofolate dehydrogenase/5,10-methenyltetrahydrofolate cyclohydrolase [Candidatus Omnitrophota bacterium]MDD5770802.1 bifunctional 5,10-methylenetetrahydrofolate dehydrogenase/5,10-methenyltetrahydrofolate cyclohydrolase [Candidatus Omnitrophota bacterium]
MAKLLEGKTIALKIQEGIRQEVRSLGFTPVLAGIITGENSASETYVESQRKIAKGLGIDYQLHKMKADIPEEELVAFIEKLNADKLVNGIIVLMPLAPRIDRKKVIRSISPDKDAEGIHPANIGRVLLGKARIVPCTASAVMELLGYTGIGLYGKEVVVVGWSEIVGKPVACLLLEKLATVSICHIGTSEAGDLEEYVRRAEVLVVAVGKAGLIKGEWIKQGAVVIDVGINRIGGKLVGDVDFEKAQERASYITPVPGGVGPLTVTMLMRNLVESARFQGKLQG